MNRVSFANFKKSHHHFQTNSSKGFHHVRKSNLNNLPPIPSTIEEEQNKILNSPYKGLLSSIDEDANFTGLEDGKLTKLLYNKLIFVENSIAFLSFLGMILAVFHFDYDYGLTNDETSTYLLSSITINTTFLCICLFFRHRLSLGLNIARGKKARNETLFTSGQIYYLLLDFCIVLPHPSSVFLGLSYSSYSPKDDIYIEYSINEIFGMLIQLRVIFIFRAFLNSTIYNKPRAYRICCIYDTEFGYLYALKALIKRYPINFLLVLILISTLLFTHAIRVCEKPFDLVSLNHEMDLGYYANAVWVIVVTIYTIGYGDFYPRSNLGRLVLFILELWGNFLISMMVVAISNLLLLDNAETKALSLIVRLEKRKKVQYEAASMIASVYKIRLGVNHKKITKFYKKKHLIKVKSHLNLMKKITRELKQKNDGVMSFEFLAKNFENFSNDLRDFSTNQTKILKKYHEDLVSLSPYKSLNLLSNNSSLSLNVGININNDSKVLNWK